MAGMRAIRCVRLSISKHSSRGVGSIGVPSYNLSTKLEGKEGTREGRVGRRLLIRNNPFVPTPTVNVIDSKSSECDIRLAKKKHSEKGFKICGCLHAVLRPRVHALVILLSGSLILIYSRPPSSTCSHPLIRFHVRLLSHSAAARRACRIKSCERDQRDPGAVMYPSKRYSEPQSPIELMRLRPFERARTAEIA